MCDSVGDIMDIDTVCTTIDFAPVYKETGWSSWSMRRLSRVYYRDKYIEHVYRQNVTLGIRTVSTRHGCQASKHKQRIRRQSGGDFLLDFPFSPIIASIKCLCSPGKFWKLESRKCHFLHFGGRIYIILKFMKRAIKKYSKSIIWDRIKLFSEAGKTNATPIHIKLVSR